MRKVKGQVSFDENLMHRQITAAKTEIRCCENSRTLPCFCASSVSLVIQIEALILAVSSVVSSIVDFTSS